MSMGTGFFDTKTSSNSKNFQTNQVVTLGRMKGNFRKGLKVYKMSNSQDY